MDPAGHRAGIDYVRLRAGCLLCGCWSGFDHDGLFEIDSDTQLVAHGGVDVSGSATTDELAWAVYQLVQVFCTSVGLGVNRQLRGTVRGEVNVLGPQ